MSKIIKKVSKIAIKAVTLAGLSKLGLMLVKKFNKDGTFEEKAYTVIDVQGEKVKNLAKLCLIMFTKISYSYMHAPKMWTRFS